MNNTNNQLIEKGIDFTKIKKNLENLKEKTPTILVLGGSLTTNHNMHIHSFTVCKNHIDSLGKEKVIGGFLIPTSDDYLYSKLGSEAISLENRNKMIELSISSSDWIINCPWGFANSFVAGESIKSMMKKIFFDELKNLKLRFICGADFAYRAHLYLKGNAISLARKGYTDKLMSLSKSFHKDFILIEHEEMKDISSTLIRDKLKKGELINEEIVHKDVAKFLLENF